MVQGLLNQSSVGGNTEKFSAQRRYGLRWFQGLFCRFLRRRQQHRSVSAATKRGVHEDIAQRTGCLLKGGISDSCVVVCNNDRIVIKNADGDIVYVPSSRTYVRRQVGFRLLLGIIRGGHQEAARLSSANLIGWQSFDFHISR